MTTATKRTIRGQQYNIAELVDSAIAAADNQVLNTDAARDALTRLNNRTPSDEMVCRYARESAILANLTHSTGAAFNGQIGKINFSNRDAAISQVNGYLNRRNSAQRSRWGK